MDLICEDALIAYLLRGYYWDSRKCELTNTAHSMQFRTISINKR